MGNFSIALSGLQAQSGALQIVSDNLANLNTAGFKGNSAVFHDLVTEALSSSTPNGAGVANVTSHRNFSQGNVQITSGAFDAAIEGNGFFVLQTSSGQQVYSRAGNFSVDAAGTLVNSNGDHVLGWMTSNGAVNSSGAPGIISVPTGSTVAPAATTNFSVTANLNAAALTTGATSTFSAPVSVVDSLGAKHTVTVTFTKTDANTWSYDITVPGEDLSGGTAGTPSSVAKGKLTFDSNGLLKSPAASDAPVDVKLTGLTNGAADLDMTWSLFDAGGTSTLTQYAQTSALASTSQDGVAAAQLTQVALGDGGSLIATFSDGTQQTIAQVAVAGIANPDSMVNIGNNNFALGGDTAAPALGAAGTGGRGQIKAGALESSNVDIATEFTNLMTFQRSYQADSRAIRTQDEILQDLMQLKA